MLQIQLYQQNHCTFIDCTGMLPYKKLPSRPGEVTFSPKYTQTDKVKQNEVKRDLFPRKEQRRVARREGIYKRIIKQEFLRHLRTKRMLLCWCNC